ncbi:KaiC domain-containing protein [Halosimplex halophilum]|uniref:KaiC domain-containing protein n=1 Tax=Halosimplex halophilum TaxID=2559572 RepID=UPI00107F7835|nr:KaiC domain-containing protein [Halosimplex halophilum]
MSDDADDDWFEDALRDDEAEETDDSAADSESGNEDDAFDDWSGDDPDDREPFDEPGDDGAFADSSDGAEPGSGTDADTRGDTGGGSPFGDTGTGDESPFGDTGNSGGSAFGDVGTGGESAFGDAGSGDGGGFGGGDGGGLFDDDFADAMGGVGGGDADFEDEDFESDIPRLDLGIEGLDNMVQGGIPLRHLMVIVGGAGTGKTTFGLQFLQHGLEKDDTDRGVFITLEQTHEDIMATARERGWEFERHEAEGNLAVVDLDPVEMANSLDNIRGELPELIEDFGADRFVLDSVSLLEMMYDDVSRRRTEVFDFTQSLKEAGVTTVLTSEANEDNPYASRHGIIEYLTDAVFLLRYVRSETQETRLAVEIQKIRNANHSRETKPYEITMDGISVYEQANIF